MLCPVSVNHKSFGIHRLIVTMYIFSRVFLPNIGPHRPQMLIMDAATPHLFGTATRLAQEANIIFVVFPGKTTHFLQPVDQILAQLQLQFSKLAYQLCMSKREFLTRPHNFPYVCNQAMQKAWLDKPEFIASAFRKTGKQ